MDDAKITNMSQFTLGNYIFWGNPKNVLLNIIIYTRQSGHSIQVRWANVQATGVKFSRDLTHRKSLKSVNV